VTPATAPFDHASALAPAGARAFWLRAADGVRLRVGHLGQGEAGTVLLIPGRTEYLEKYGEAAGEFAAYGFGTLTLDYRGQGLADRPLPDRRVGHVADFADYQKDVAALVAFAEARALPRPWFLLSHSLGGAIAYRALLEGLAVRAAVFSSPMWGIRMNPLLPPVAWGLGWLADRAGWDDWVVPGMGRETYVRTAPPDDNLLTTDPAMLARMRAQLDAVPGLDLGAPSVPWLYRALVECRALQRAAPPAHPMLAFLPGEECIVCPRAIRAITARWPDARLELVEGGRHETMMETPARRRRFYDAVAGFFRDHHEREAA